MCLDASTTSATTISTVGCSPISLFCAAETKQLMTISCRFGLVVCYSRHILNRNQFHRGGSLEPMIACININVFVAVIQKLTSGSTCKTGIQTNLYKWMTKLAELVPKCSERISQNSQKLHMSKVNPHRWCASSKFCTLWCGWCLFFCDVKGDVFRCWTTFYQVSWWNGVNWAHTHVQPRHNSLIHYVPHTMHQYESVLSPRFSVGLVSYLSIIPWSLRSFLSPCWQVHCWRITFTISGWAGLLCNTWTSLGSLFYGSGRSHKSWSLVLLLHC